MQKLNCLIFFLFSVTLLFAQNNNMVVTGTAVQPRNAKVLNEQFKKYEVFDVAATQLKNQINNQSEVLFSLKLGDKTWDMHLLRNRKVDRNRLITVVDEQGKRSYRANNSPQVWRGYLRRDPASSVSLTLNDGFMYGMVVEGENTYFIEPADIFTGEPGQHIVVYNAADVREEMKDFCGAGELEKATKEYIQDTDHDHQAHTRSMMGCVEVDLALAADYLMFQKYGSTQGVENRIEGVLNNVAANYDNEFNDEISFISVEYFISTCSSCDPWTNSTSASALLNSFTNWGNGGGFSGPFDLAGIWTNRNFSGSTIGIAWLSGVCFSTKYHAIQDFSTNAALMRVLVAHEIGHNFSSGHDPSGSRTIMAPSVNSTNTWSVQSQNAINGFYPGLFCLSSCTVNIPPIAAFTSDVTEGCPTLTVNFMDASSNNPTSWDWSFPGGTPSFSFDENPTVSYDTPGIYDVSLTVSNPAGSDSETINGYVVVNGPPAPDFLVTFLQDTAYFANITVDGDTYLWTFGDGDFSTEENPIHVYPFDGDYDVTLTATNDCGTESITRTVTVVTRPTADFTSTNPIGCDSLSVTFTNNSSPNITSISWEFPGGIPATSTAPNPTVRYLTPGIYDVRLTVSNSLYTDVEERLAYVDLGEGPAAGFVYLENNLTVDFTSTGTGAETYNWNFGDGSSSTDQNPTRTYAAGGNYTVTLVVQNDCGLDTASSVVSLLGVPLASFVSDVDTGCAPFQVTYTDTSSPAVTSREWYFPGAIPPSSTDPNPVVTYEQSGFYDVTLIVFNNLGSDTLTIIDYIEADSIPIANFGAYPNGLTVQFRDSSAHADTLCWDFGDGDTTIFVKNPIHTYSQDGNYTVRLITKNECGRDTMVKNVMVATLPTADFTVDQTSGCTPFIANFTSLASANTTSWAWSFPGGSPATSGDENPSVNYNAAGVYDVTLIVSTAAGSDTLSRSAYITVDEAPNTSFTYTVSGTIATFANTSTNATSYSWDFGDGNTSTETSPSHDYGTDGDYTVTLSGTNSCGTTTFTQTINIVTLPAGSFSANPTTGCAPFTTAFTGPAGNISSYSWSFPGGNPSSSTDQNPMVTYANEGTYDVTLVITNPAGSTTITETDYISVDDVPVAGFTVSISGTQVTFTNTSTNANNYNWSFGDGNTSTATSPTHDYAADGIYTVTLDATNACGSVTSQQSISIVTTPTADFTANQTSGCAPLTVNFTDASSANTTSWTWRFNGGSPSSSTEQNPVVTYDNAGTYDVELVVRNNAGQDSVLRTDYITVNEGPAAGFTYSLNGTVATFTNTSSNATSYNWNFGDGTTSTETSPVHDFLTDGVFTVILSATNACGTVTAQQIITTTTTPVAGFTANQTTGCTPMTVSFTDGSTTNTTSWSWSFPGGNPSFSSDRNPVVVYDNPGVYDVTLTAGNSAGQNTLTESDYITVNNIPTAEFISSVTDATVVFTNRSDNATSYSWNFGDGNISTEVSPTHTYATDGTYIVVLSATNECGTVTSQESIAIVTPPTADFTANQTSGCAPMTVQFTNGATANTTNWRWSFPGGSPSFSTDPNPVVTYNSAGTFDVELEVSNSAGRNTVLRTDLIVVNDLPDAGFTSSVSGTITTFTNTSSNATSYSWEFGDGNTSTDPSPVHDYGTDGVYTVTLSATNECGTVTSQQTVTVITAPIAAFTADQTSGCAVLTVNFMDASSSNSTNWNWRFPGGTPSFSTQQNPTITYSNPGTYNVELTVRNSAGQNTVTQTAFIEVNDVPTAAFSSVVNGTQATFTNTSANATSYSWDFDDGNSSTEANPIHQYATDGTYSVTLTATNECGSVTTTETVNIITAPTAGFTVNNTNGCTPFSVLFTNTSSDNTTNWSWSFPGGSPSFSSSQNPMVRYNTPGNYSVSLVVTNSAGSDTLTQTDLIVVNSIPSAGFSSSTVDNQVTFTNLSTNATSYLWDFGDGMTSTEESPVHVYGASGDYQVSLVATNECGNASFVQTVNIIQVTVPLAGFTADITSGCAPLEVSFSDQSSDNVTSWEWEFEGGTPATSTEQNPVVTYTEAGLYTVTLIVRNSAGSNSSNQIGYIQVEETPSADFTAQQNNLEVNFINESSVTASNATFNWDFGDGGTSVVENPTYIYAQAGTYIVQLIVSNNCGMDTVSRELVIENNIAPSAAIGFDALSGCAPLTISFSDRSTGDPTAWNWTADGGDPLTSTEQNPVISFDQPGTFDVQLIVSNSFGEDTSSVTITVIDVPEAAFSSAVNDAEVTFVNNSVRGANYRWDFGDGNTSTDESPTHTYAGSGTYLVELIVSNTCGEDTVRTEVVIMLTNTNEQEWLSDLRIHPNPNDGHFEFFLQSPIAEDLQVRMFNVVGQQVFYSEELFAGGTLNRNYDFSALPKGTYLFQLVAGSNYALRKIVIQ